MDDSICGGVSVLSKTTKLWSVCKYFIYEKFGFPVETGQEEEEKKGKEERRQLHEKQLC